MGTYKHWCISTKNFKEYEIWKYKKYGMRNAVERNGNRNAWGGLYVRCRAMWSNTACLIHSFEELFLKLDWNKNNRGGRKRMSSQGITAHHYKTQPCINSRKWRDAYLKNSWAPETVRLLVELLLMASENSRQFGVFHVLLHVFHGTSERHEANRKYTAQAIIVL